MNKLRTLVVFMAVVSLLFFALTTWVGIDIPKYVMDITQLIAGVFVALGILADTGKMPQPLTKASIIEKLKSPIGVGSLFALLSYLVYLKLAPGEADMVLKMLNTIIVGIFGFGVYNSPNLRGTVR